MKNNKLIMFAIGLLLIYLEIYFITSWDWMYFHHFQIQLLLPFIVAGFWITKAAPLSKLNSITSYLVLLLILIESYFGTYLGVVEYFIVWIIIQYLDVFEGEEVKLSAFAFLIILYSVLKASDAILYILYTQQMIVVTFQLVYVQVLEVFLNIVLTLFFHKIFNKRYKL